MLRFGIVSQIDPINVLARVNFGDDDLTSFWLPVLQTKTLKDKFYVMPDVGEQVACLMDENSEDGVILGAIYSSEDKPILQSEKEMGINLDCEASVHANKEEQTLTVIFKKMKLIGDIEHDGNLKNTKGIKSDADITDKKSSMQDMRNTYNGHTHTGNKGSPTSSPHQSM